ncbi:MAG: adenosylmethionine decarboxylase [Pseudomonadota bacterium]|nr:adenosylmethionine decarboxylase [Pseudomonadota bacterium]
MERLVESAPLELQGFNNLTKTLNFNLYDFAAARSVNERDSYVAYVNENFNRQKISAILRNIAEMIAARVLAISDQDYRPWGASSMLLLSDSIVADTPHPPQPANVPVPVSVAAHLDKSHICAHTYPDFKGEVCSFRLDISISTCGKILPLRALNYMFGAFESDVVIIDYLVRGFTRSNDGKQVYLDHDLDSIQDYLEPKILDDYACYDHNNTKANVWQTKLIRKRMNEPSYFRDEVDLNTAGAQRTLSLIKAEMEGVFHNR